MIFEAELEALTKYCKVMSSHPDRSLDNNEYQQFNPEQPYPSPYIPQMSDHQPSYSQPPYPQL